MPKSFEESKGLRWKLQGSYFQLWDTEKALRGGDCSIETSKDKQRGKTMGKGPGLSLSWQSLGV